MPDPPPEPPFRMLGHRPAAPLRGGISRMTGFAGDAGGRQVRQELPNAGVPLILCFGDSVTISSAAGSDRYTSFLAGPHAIPVTTEHAGTLRCLQVDLTPLGAYQLLGVPMYELADTVVHTDQLPQPQWSGLAERLAEQPDWPTRFRLLEHTFSGWLRDGRPIDPEVRWAWHRLTVTHGGIGVGALAGEIGWSRRHFTDRFRRQVGLSPKTAARVLRFHRALALLRTGTAGSISAVAATAGYADHSHLTREFTRFTGAAPSRLLVGAGR